MPTERAYSTEFLPLLSRGRHRRPRKGACFMEFASYLAGERWSDHSACTHPLLVVLARHVNDYVSDEARQSLVGLVPDVIGLTGSDLRIDVRIALRAARTAVPVVAEERQWAMATARARRRPDRTVQRRRSRPSLIRSSRVTRSGRGPSEAGRRDPVRGLTYRRSERSECCCGLTLRQMAWDTQQVAVEEGFRMRGSRT